MQGTKAMKKFSLLIIVCLSVALAGCTTLNSVHPTNQQIYRSSSSTAPIQKCKKNPLAVSFYTEQLSPPNFYTVMGVATVSKFNKVGIKRQEALIHDAMRDIAASMGGDAIINIKHDAKTVSGTVISYRANIVV